MATEKHKLVSYVKDEIFDWFKREREREIEETWALAYDAFRGKYSSDNLKRWRELEGHDWRSKVFVRLTKMKIVAAISQIEDIYFQGGEIPFDITPTPVPEFAPGMMMPPEMAKASAHRMKDRIKDILVQTKYERTTMASILEAAIYGMSVHKCPVLRPRRKVSYQCVPPDMTGMGMDWMQFRPELLVQYARFRKQESVIQVPTAEHINIWDFFWDMEGKDLQDGIGCIHRVKMSKGQLRQLADSPHYDHSAIEKVIAMHTEDGYAAYERNDGPARMSLERRRRGIDVIEFSGRVPVKYLLGTDLEISELDGREAEVIVTIAGDEIIRQPVINPLPLRQRPFHIARWEDLPHEIHGVGIPENMQDSQMMVNSGVRCYIDNKSLSGNLMLAGSRRALAPGQDYSVSPGKFFELADHVTDVRQALQWFAPPDVGAGMLELVNMFREFADLESNLPSIMQGQQEAHAPKTAFAFSRLLENANKQLGKVIRNIDEGQTEPDVQAIYHWLMETDPDQSIKGDYDVKATGFASFKDQVIQADNLQNLLMLSLSNQMIAGMTKVPEFIREIARVRGVDPDRFYQTLEWVDENAQLKQIVAEMQAMINPPPGLSGQPGIPQPEQQHPAMLPAMG